VPSPETRRATRFSRHLAYPDARRVYFRQQGKVTAPSRVRPLVLLSLRAGFVAGRGLVGDGN